MSDRETCSRCGHQSGGCPRCGRNDFLLGGRIEHQDYCHTFVETAPTCYTQEAAERAEWAP